MRLASYIAGGKAAFGAVTAEGVIDLRQRLGGGCHSLREALAGGCVGADG